MSKIRGIVIALGIAALTTIGAIVPQSAEAAKEVFQRTKPHCNAQIVRIFTGADSFLAFFQTNLTVEDETGRAWGELMLYGENGESLQLKAVEGAVRQTVGLVIFIIMEAIRSDDEEPDRFAVTIRPDPSIDDCLIFDIVGSTDTAIHYTYDAVGNILSVPPPDRE